MAVLQYRRSRENLFAYLLLLPALVVITFVIIIPLIEAVTYSFTQISLINLDKKTFVGMDNYKALFKDPSFWTALKNTLFIVFVSVAVSLIIGMLLALVLNRSGHAKFARGLLIIPWLLPGIVVGLIWKWVLATEGGVLNYLLRLVGLSESNFPFLSDQTVTPWLVVVVFVWSSVPYVFVTALAALQAVPQDLEEAAIIDGANSFQRFFSIIVPIITPVLSIAIVLRIIYTMQDFAIIYSLTQGGPGDATETFVIRVYNLAFQKSQIGMACTVGVVWLFLLLIFILAYFKLSSISEKRMYS